MTRAYRWGGRAAIALCVWIVLNILLSMFANGHIFYTTISPMPYLQQNDTHVIFYSWYWLWRPMTVRSGKLLECDGRVTSFTSVEVALPGGVGHNEYGWKKPEGAKGVSCVLRGTVTTSPFGPLGAKMITPWVSEPFVLGEP